VTNEPSKSLIPTGENFVGDPITTPIIDSCVEVEDDQSKAQPHFTIRKSRKRLVSLVGSTRE
jgi:hypothetical protein